MRYEIKRLEIWPIVKIAFIISLLFGFFMGLLNAAFFLLVDAIAQTVARAGFDNSQTFDSSFVAFILMFSTLFVAFLSTFAAMVLTGLYNLFAGWFGGFIVELKSVDQTDKVSSTVG